MVRSNNKATHHIAQREQGNVCVASTFWWDVSVTHLVAVCELAPASGIRLLEQCAVVADGEYLQTAKS